MNDIRKLRDKIQNISKGTHVSVLSESNIALINEWLPTPAYDLNRIITGDFYKGPPQKSFTLIAGPEHSFKSSFMCLCMAAAQKIGYTPIYIDTEGLKLDFFVRWGINTDEMLYIYTPWVEEAMLALAQIKQSQERKYIIGIDSVGGFEREKMMTDALAGDIKADQGRLQKDLKQMAKLLLNICRGQDSIVLSAGHFYGSPAMFAPPEELGGGRAWKLFPDIIIGLKKTKIRGKDNTVIGSEIDAITLKNRFHPPFTEGKIKIDYINGIDKFVGLVDLAIKAGLVEKGGAGWYTYGSEKVQGVDNLNKLFAENEHTFISQLNEWVKKSGYSTVNMEIKEMEESKEVEVISTENDEGEKKEKKNGRNNRRRAGD
jgi:recombination protein RecA